MVPGTMDIGTTETGTTPIGTMETGTTDTGTATGTTETGTATLTGVAVGVEAGDTDWDLVWGMGSAGAGVLAGDGPVISGPTAMVGATRVGDLAADTGPDIGAVMDWAITV